MNEKRGLSSIVITLVIIGLSLVAISIVWGVVRNLLQGNSKQVQIESLTVDLDISTAYEQGGNINVGVTRTSGEVEITNIKFILSDGGDSEVITQNITSFEKLDFQKFVLTPIKLIPATILTVSVAPVMRLNDGTEMIGDIADTYTILQGEGASEDNNGNGNIPGCTPDCSELQCGLDSLCLQSCGTCDILDTCTNGVCVVPNCVPESTEITCEGIVCGEEINNCGAEISCNPCPTGKFCSSHTCIDITLLNSGIVEEIWPGTSGLYFGSSSLPTDKNYFGNYIKFTGGTETRCLLIVIYKLPVEGYSKSHIGFNFETLITTGNDYQIFSTYEECQVA